MSRAPNAQYNVAAPGSLPVRIAGRQRRVMFDAFARQAAAGPVRLVLDVGVTSDQSYDHSNYFEAWYPHKARITAVRRRRCDFPRNSLPRRVLHPRRRAKAPLRGQLIRPRSFERSPRACWQSGAAGPVSQRAVARDPRDIVRDYAKPWLPGRVPIPYCHWSTGCRRPLFVRSCARRAAPFSPMRST